MDPNSAKELLALCYNKKRKSYRIRKFLQETLTNVSSATPAENSDDKSVWDDSFPFGVVIEKKNKTYIEQVTGLGKKYKAYIDQVIELEKKNKAYIEQVTKLEKKLSEAEKNVGKLKKNLEELSLEKSRVMKEKKS
ncbi:hypothetical protein RYX36_018354 [Vicia faba]